MQQARRLTQSQRGSRAVYHPSLCNAREGGHLHSAAAEPEYSGQNCSCISLHLLQRHQSDDVLPLHATAEFLSPKHGMFMMAGVCCSWEA